MLSIFVALAFAWALVLEGAIVGTWLFDHGYDPGILGFLLPRDRAAQLKATRRVEIQADRKSTVPIGGWLSWSLRAGHLVPFEPFTPCPRCHVFAAHHIGPPDNRAVPNTRPLVTVDVRARRCIDPECGVSWYEATGQPTAERDDDPEIAYLRALMDVHGLQWREFKQ